VIQAVRGRQLPRHRRDLVQHGPGPAELHLPTRGANHLDLQRQDAPL